MRKYKHLALSDRNQIEILKEKGYKQKDIAKVLGKDASTISREIKKKSRRKRVKGGLIIGKYEAKTAHLKYQSNRRFSKFQCMKIEKSAEIKDYVAERLKLHWSPEQISGRLKLEKKKFCVGKTSIYKWLYSSNGQYYCKFLPSHRYYRKRRRKKKFKKVLIPNRIGIEKRPMFVNKRLEYGHFEIDTIVSGKNGTGALAVVEERKARIFDMKKIPNMKPDSFNYAVSNILSEFNNTKSATFDNGVENTKHDKLGLNTFFCNPYSSWEKGGVENLNGLIRRFIPKGSDISKYSPVYIKKIVNIINNKPRKILGFKSPYEVAMENNLLRHF